MTEGPCRMRKKMVKNHQFYTHYPYRPELESGDNVIVSIERFNLIKCNNFTN